MRSQRGQSTVELVLLMPLLLVLIFLIFEVGRLFGSWLLITNAAREGARYAAVQCVPSSATTLATTCPTGTDPTSAIETRVQQTASFLAVQTTACTVSGNTITVPSGSTSCIAVVYSTDNSAGNGDSSGNSDGIVTVRVAYNVQTLMPITGTVPFLGTINYPGSQEVTATQTMRLEQ